MAIIFECRSCGSRVEAEPGAAVKCPACGAPMVAAASGATAVKTAAPVAMPPAAGEQQTARPTVRRAVPIGASPVGVASAAALSGSGVKVAKAVDQAITAAGLGSDTTKRLQALKERAAAASPAEIEEIRNELLQQARAQAQQILDQARVQEQELLRRAQENAAAEVSRLQETAKREAAQSREAAAAEAAKVREEAVAWMVKAKEAAAAETARVRELAATETGKARELASAEVASMKEQARKEADALRKEAETRARQEGERVIAASRGTAATDARKIVSQAQAEAEKKTAELLAAARQQAAADKEKLLTEARQQAAAEMAKLKAEGEKDKGAPSKAPAAGPANGPVTGARKPVWGRGPSAFSRREAAAGAQSSPAAGPKPDFATEAKEGAATAAPRPRPASLRDLDMHGMSDVEKASYTARRDLVNQHAKKEARNLMFGLIAGTILAFYLIFVLLRGHPATPLKYFTIGLLTVDVLFVLWQMWTVFRHLLQGTRAKAAHQERLKSVTAGPAASKVAPAAAGNGFKAGLTSNISPITPAPTATEPVAPTKAAETASSPKAAAPDSKAIQPPAKPAAPPAPPVPSAATAAELAAVKAELNALKAYAAKPKGEPPVPQGDSAALKAEVEALKAAAAKPAVEIEALKTEAAALKVALEAARTDAATAKAEASAAKETLAAATKPAAGATRADMLGYRVFGRDAESMVLGIGKAAGGTGDVPVLPSRPRRPARQVATGAEGRKPSFFEIIASFFSPGGSSSGGAGTRRMPRPWRHAAPQPPPQLGGQEPPAAEVPKPSAPASADGAEAKSAAKPDEAQTSLPGGN